MRGFGRHRGRSGARWRNDAAHFAAVLLPPLAVRMCGRADLLPLSIFLTLLLWVPGVVHALWVVSDHQANEQANRLLTAFRNHIGR
jgi:uncharacterized membrane protein YqaE (UPF0057 family)